jgi:adenylate cyclase class 1
MNIQQILTIRLLRLMRYNKSRVSRAIELLPDDKKPLFHVIPFLLHVNHPDLPAYVEDKGTPFGLNNYSLRAEIKDALNLLFPQHKALFADMRKLWPEQRMIDSLLLMGSIGTIGQSGASDFDYWACIDGSLFSKAQKVLLQQKLSLIERWAEQEHDIEVHFFLSEVDNVYHNDFGEADGESSGSAQAVFLKAEFYTTHILVAGKAPMWWLTPDDATNVQYGELIAAMNPGDSPDPKWFMDLGNLPQMDPDEIFGAAIWQISKAMDSPFKSVLKMAKLEVFLENIEQRQPLCNTLKKMVHSGKRAPGDLEHVDPYALMFDELIQHYTEVGDQDVINLLQLCLYIKCDCALSKPASAVTDTFKRKIITSYVQSWAWSDGKVEKLDRLKKWPIHDLLFLSAQLHRFLIGCYRRISGKIGQGKQTVNPQDMTVIGRKIDSYYSKKPNKINYLRSAFDDELFCKLVSINAVTEANGNKRWSLLAGKHVNGISKGMEKAHLFSSHEPLDLILWGVSNRILNSASKILLDYNTDPLADDDFYQIIERSLELFAPLRVSEISREALLTPARVCNCLVVINFASRRLKPEIESLNVIYSTSWGELYNVSGFKALAKIRRELFEPKRPPVTYLMAPEGSHKQRLFENFHRLSDVHIEHTL